MTKEEYMEEHNKSIDEMPIEQLRTYAKGQWLHSKEYFHNWMEERNQRIELEVEISLLKSK